MQDEDTNSGRVGAYCSSTGSLLCLRPWSSDLKGAKPKSNTPLLFYHCEESHKQKDDKAILTE
jgi:hypothetical protein